MIFTHLFNQTIDTEGTIPPGYIREAAKWRNYECSDRQLSGPIYSVGWGCLNPGLYGPRIRRTPFSDEEIEELKQSEAEFLASMNMPPAEFVWEGDSLVRKAIDL